MSRWRHALRVRERARQGHPAVREVAAAAVGEFPDAEAVLRRADCERVEREVERRNPQS